MNICILNHCADNLNRRTTRSYDLGKQLVERGHTATTFTAGFNHYFFKEDRIRSVEARWKENEWRFRDVEFSAGARAGRAHRR